MYTHTDMEKQITESNQVKVKKLDHLMCFLLPFPQRKKKNKNARTWKIFSRTLESRREL